MINPQDYAPLEIEFHPSEGYRVIKENEFSILQHKIKGKWKTIAREINIKHEVKITCTNNELTEIEKFIRFLNFWEREIKRRRTE